MIGLGLRGSRSAFEQRERTFLNVRDRGLSTGRLVRSDQQNIRLIAIQTSADVARDVTAPKRRSFDGNLSYLTRKETELPNGPAVLETNVTLGSAPAAGAHRAAKPNESAQSSRRIYGPFDSMKAFMSLSERRLCWLNNKLVQMPTRVSLQPENPSTSI